MKSIKFHKTLFVLSLTMLSCSVFMGVKAQDRPTKIALVEIPKLIKGHPKGYQIESLITQRSSELKPLQQKIGEIKLRVNSTGGSISDKEQITQITKSINLIGGKYDLKIQAVAKEIDGDIANALSKYAIQNDISLIVDGSAPQAAGFVVYHNDKVLNATNAILKIIK